LGGIWGLIIATSGGFRFHHFPQAGWFDLLSRFSQEQPQERTIFIPHEKVISAELIKETRWWKRLFSASPPHLVICYTGEAGEEKRLLLEAEYKANDLPQKLKNREGFHD
jgi:hypothetical protein